MKLTKLSYSLVTCVVLGVTSGAFAQEKEKKQDQPKQAASEGASKSGKVAPMDKAWAEMSAAQDAAELRLSKAAQEKASSEEVKQFAAKMIQDHTKSSQELKQIAQKNNLDLKAEIPEAKQELIKELTSKSGAEFDQAYMEHQLAAHRIAVAHYQNGSELLKNQELQSFAQKTLPILQGHLSMVQKQGGHGAHSGQSGAGAAGAAGAGSKPAPTAPPGAGQPASGQQKP